MVDWQQITVVVAAVVQLDSTVGCICRVSLGGLFRSEYFVFTESRSTIIGGILSALGLSVSVQALLGLGLKESRSRVDWRNGMLTMDAPWRETTATSRIQVIQELSRSSSRGSAVLHKSVRGTRSRQ